MSKVKVLRVPDERLIHLKHNLPDGAIVLHGDNRTRRVIMPDEKPALLAALLEDGRRWVTLRATSRSGKTLFCCLDCGRISPTPDKWCEGLQFYSGEPATCGDHPVPNRREERRIPTRPPSPPPRPPQPPSEE